MARAILTALFTGLFTCALFAQQVPDSLITAQGRVLNAETKEPVVAKITYQSLPYGNKMGSITNSTFSFPMFDGDRYSVLVEAVGFAPAKYMLDPSEANAEGKVVKDIELSHSGNAPSSKHAVGHVMRLDNLIFQTGKSKIDPGSFSELNQVVAMMNENRTMVIQLEGHTDYIGDPGQNMKLSQQRVDAVRDYLKTKGINKNRIKTKAFGGSQPLSRDDTPEAHRMNRRVELRILEN